MKKILFVDFGFTVNIAGGGVRVMSEMTDAFVKRGYECIFVCSDNAKGSIFFPMNKNVKIINLNRSKPTLTKKIKREWLRFIGLLNNEKMFNEIYHGKKIKDKFLKYIKKFMPDVIISFDFQSLITLSAIKNEINVPVISMIHTGAKYIFNNSISDFHKKIYAYPDVIQVLTENDVNVVKKILKQENIVYIGNPVNEPKEYLKDHSKCNKTIINIGRIIRSSKQQLMLVKAFNLIAPKYPGWNIEFWGEAHSEDQMMYKDEIRKFCIENSLQDQVKFNGETNNIYEKIQKADICAFSSKKEGFALGLAECMAVGLPAIGYRSCSGVNSIIKNGFNGFLVDDGIDDFAEKLEILISNEELRKKMGVNAYKSMKVFAPEKIWDQWEILINKLIDQKSFM